MADSYNLHHGKQSAATRFTMKLGIITRGCKRCGGDLYGECDEDGTYRKCLQCGARYTPQNLILETVQISD